MADRWARKAHMARQKHKTDHKMKGTSGRYVPIRTFRRTVALSVVPFPFIIHMAICHVPNTINTLITRISLMLFDCAPPLPPPVHHHHYTVTLTVSARRIVMPEMELVPALRRFHFAHFSPTHSLR
ncbi:hypothetical protein CGRA01v4_11645 [Colletotrichum graminicola]|nr:hypothetical protein CGRA01v4_11645 [Colletotrichum graminicola]